MGSQIYPTEGWRDLGTFRVSERGGEQRFEVGERGEHFDECCGNWTVF